MAGKKIKKNFRKYSFAEKMRYHLNRSSGSSNKAVYSRHWVDGATDTHAENNYNAVKSEISNRKAKKVPFSVYDIGLIGYRNGLRAKLKK